MSKLTSLDEAKDQIIGERGSERREQYEKEIRLAKTKIEKRKKIFNWGEISRIFSGTRSVIRHDSIPKVHEPIINEIIDAVDGILKREGIIK